MKGFITRGSKNNDSDSTKDRSILSKGSYSILEVGYYLKVEGETVIMHIMNSKKNIKCKKGTLKTLTDTSLKKIHKLQIRI